MSVQRGGSQKGNNTGNRSSAGKQAKPQGNSPGVSKKGRSEENGRKKRLIIASFWILMFTATVIAFFMLLPAVKQKAGNIEDQPPLVQPAAENPPVESPIQPAPVQNPPETNQNIIPPPVEEKIPSETGLSQLPPDAGTEENQKPAAKQNNTEASVPPEQPDKSIAVSRERNIYLMRPESGELVLAKVKRNLTISDSPLLDSINALIAGPLPEEEKLGMINCIPPGSRLISALIRGSTAYLNFNEEFTYNTLGLEGSVAQIRLIVWTATEFPNVKDVQILIEGKRLDFLTEGVEIGSPLGRNP